MGGLSFGMDMSMNMGGGFSPFAVGRPIVLLDAARGITLNGADVSGWADQSGNGNDATQATEPNQPLWNASDADFNGNPSVEGDGVSEYMQTAVFSGGDIPQPNTIFTVMKYEALGAGNFFLMDGINAAKRNAIFQGAVNFSLYAGTSVVSVQARDTNPHVWPVLFNGASSSSWLDGGTPVTPATPGANALSGVSLFTQPALGGYGTAKLAYLIIYNANLSDIAKNYIGRALAARFGTTWTDI